MCLVLQDRQGEYAEGDQFIGIAVPVQRRISLQFKHLDLAEVEKLIASKVHEHRFVALEILVARYEGDPASRREIFSFYLNHTRWVNNWDLVDTSASY